MSTPLRLQKYLAQCGVCSRRKAESLIQEGRVSVDGKVVSDMGVKVDPVRQQVTFDGRLLQRQEIKEYYLLNKPKGYVTTASDPQGRPVVTELITTSNARLFPVGRLDLDTEGALLLTNDGELAQRIQHPSHEVQKTYEALIRAKPATKKLRALEAGIMLEGRKTAPARVTVIESGQRSCRVRITIHEGRKRQVKKMFSAIGHPVVSLKRLSYGALSLGDLAKGRYRRLTPKDLKKIFQNSSLQTKK